MSSLYTWTATTYVHIWMNDLRPYQISGHSFERQNPIAAVYILVLLEYLDPKLALHLRLDDQLSEP